MRETQKPKEHAESHARGPSADVVEKIAHGGGARARSGFSPVTPLATNKTAHSPQVRHNKSPAPNGSRVSTPPVSRCCRGSGQQQQKVAGAGLIRKSLRVTVCILSTTIAVELEASVAVALLAT